MFYCTGVDIAPGSRAQKSGRTVMLQPVWLQKDSVKGSFSWEYDGLLFLYRERILGVRV